jgi:hypothetical protein
MFLTETRTFIQVLEQQQINPNKQVRTQPMSFSFAPCYSSRRWNFTVLLRQGARGSAKLYAGQPCASSCWLRTPAAGVHPPAGSSACTGYQLASISRLLQRHVKLCGITGKFKSTTLRNITLYHSEVQVQKFRSAYII